MAGLHGLSRFRNGRHAPLDGFGLLDGFDFVSSLLALLLWVCSVSMWEKLWKRCCASCGS